MEYGVNGTHRIRELKGKRMGAGLGNDFEWAKEFFREFLGGPRGMDVLRFNEDLIGDLEIWRWVMTSVGGDGVSALCRGTVTPMTQSGDQCTYISGEVPCLLKECVKSLSS